MIKCDICTWHSLIGFCVVSAFGWLFCAALLTCFAEKTPDIADLMRQNDKVAKSLWKWSTIGAISLGVLWVAYDVTQH